LPVLCPRQQKNPISFTFATGGSIAVHGKSSAGSEYAAARVQINDPVKAVREINVLNAADGKVRFLPLVNQDTYPALAGNKKSLERGRLSLGRSAEMLPVHTKNMAINCDKRRKMGL